MSGEIFTSTTLAPVVTALQGAISTTDIVNLFTSGVTVALPLILVWFGARWVLNYGMLIENVVNASKSGVYESMLTREAKIVISCQA